MKRTRRPHRACASGTRPASRRGGRQSRCPAERLVAPLLCTCLHEIRHIDDARRRELHFQVRHVRVVSFLIRLLLLDRRLPDVPPVSHWSFVLRSSSHYLCGSARRERAAGSPRRACGSRRCPGRRAGMGGVPEETPLQASAMRRASPAKCGTLDPARIRHAPSVPLLVEKDILLTRSQEECLVHGMADHTRRFQIANTLWPFSFVELHGSVSIEQLTERHARGTRFPCQACRASWLLAAAASLGCVPSDRA
jgi:hypothetical protein